MGDVQGSGIDLWGQAIAAEILAIIFSLVIGPDGAVPGLPRLGCVCKHWQRVSLLPKLWKRVCLVNLSGLTNSAFTRLCSHQLKHTESLNLVGCPKLQTQGYMAIAYQCRQLLQLSILYATTFTAASLNAITEKLDRLKCLRLEGLPPEVDTQSLIEMIRTRGPQLRILSLAGCYGVNRSLMQSLANSCRRLTYLDLSLNKFGSLSVDLLREGCPHLTSLHLDRLNLHSYSILPDEPEPSGFKDLHFLTLEDSFTFPTVRTVKRLLHESSRLDTLDIRGWCDYTCNSLVDSLPQTSNLRHLFVARWKFVRIPAFMAAISVYTQLIELDLNFCNGIDDAAVTLFAQTPVASSIKALHLTASFIKATGLRTILAACPQLESLDLTGCLNLPRGLQRMHNRDSIQEMRNSMLG